MLRSKLFSWQDDDTNITRACEHSSPWQCLLHGRQISGNWYPLHSCGEYIMIVLQYIQSIYFSYKPKNIIWINKTIIWKVIKTLVVTVMYNYKTLFLGFWDLSQKSKMSCSTNFSFTSFSYIALNFT